jgi:hypothetical protein
MNPREAVDRYYDACQNKAGDFSEVPGHLRANSRAR